MTIGEKIIRFFDELEFIGILPEGVQVMNPAKDNPAVKGIIRSFYSRFYSDNSPRQLILGINPGRFGAGATGIPFTDTRRLNEQCGIRFTEFRTYEPSSAFVYEMIDVFGGTTHFYGRFLVSAICPLGFTREGNRGKQVNYNYYDSKELLQTVRPFIVETLRKQCAFGIDMRTCFCLGTGRNYLFLEKLNQELHLFGRIIALEHPRFIMQYRAKEKEQYIRKYVEVLRGEG